MLWARLPGPILLLSLTCQSQAIDARFIQVSKRILHVQNGLGASVIQTNGYEFRARVDLSTQDIVSSGSFYSPPRATLRSLTNFQTYLEFSQRFATSDSLNFAFPNGTYSVVTRAVSDGPHTNQLTLSADFYPNPLHIANFTAAQLINPRNDFTLQWDTPGTAASDFMQLRLLAGDQVVFETGSVPGAVGTLSGAATSALVPRGTLRDGALYRAQLIASRKSTSDTKGYPGVGAWAIYTRTTEFPVRAIYPTLDVNWYGMSKVRRHMQSSAATPVPLSGAAYAFSAFANATDALNVLNASVRLPSGSVQTLGATGRNWTWQQTFDTQAQLDGGYTAGAYELNLQTAHNGAQKLTLPLGAATFPPPPQIANWDEASALNSAAPFTLKWLAPAGGNADDFIQVIVRRGDQTLFRSGDYPGATGSLDGGSTSVTLPAGLLLPGDSADVTLLFLKAMSRDTYSYPQALGLVGCGCETRATLRARGGNVPVPTMSGPALVNRGIEFAISTVPGRLYVIQASPDLRTWSDFWVTNAAAAQLNVRFDVPLLQKAMSFRVLAN